MSAFDDFWAVCPRKIGKGDARRKWAAAVDLAPAETIISAMRAFAAIHAQEKTPMQFICHPATWLHQERWEDDPEGYRRNTRTDAQRADDANYEAFQNLRGAFEARDRRRLQ